MSETPARFAPWRCVPINGALMETQKLDSTQAASATQFDRQSDRYGRTHILADTSDVAAALAGIVAPPGGVALDVATGGGHTALWLASHGWKVIAADIAPRMLENARRLASEAGCSIDTRLFPAEAMPLGDASVDLVTVRVAPHHFSSPRRFVTEAARVLRPGGHFMLIDGSVPDNDPETEEWLHRVEVLRDPTHVRLLSRAAWEELVRGAGLTVQKSELHPLKQPDLEWYFQAAATPPDRREKVIEAIRRVSPHVRSALRLAVEDGKTVWWWSRITLVARR